MYLPRYYLLLKPVRVTWHVQPTYYPPLHPPPLPTEFHPSRGHWSQGRELRNRNGKQNERTNEPLISSPLDHVQETNNFSLPVLFLGYIICHRWNFKVSSVPRGWNGWCWCGYCGWEEKVIPVGRLWLTKGVTIYPYLLSIFSWAI